jgi:hypothetical protein
MIEALAVVYGVFMTATGFIPGEICRQEAESLVHLNGRHAENR